MKKKRLILTLTIAIFLLGIAELIIQNTNQKKLKPFKNIIQANTNNTIEIENINFKDVSKYHYDVTTGNMKVNNKDYRVKVEEDGVILIYNSNGNLEASSKEPVCEPNVFYKDKIELAELNELPKQTYKIEVNGESIKISLYNTDKKIYESVIEHKLSGYMSKDDNAIELEYDNVKFTLNVEADAKLLVKIERETQTKPQTKNEILYNWDYIAHRGHGIDETINEPANEEILDVAGKTNVNELTDQEKREIKKYIKYTKPENYQGTDITSYNEELYKNYNNNFKDIIYDIAESTTYSLDKKIQDESKGAKADNIKIITLVNGTYLINSDYNKDEFTSNNELGGASTEGGFGIVIPSYITLDLNGATLKQINDSRNNISEANGKDNYKMLRIESGKNITIKNGTLVGDKAERATTTSGERGIGILLATTDGDGEEEVTIKNVEISSMILKYMTGDGVEINRPKSASNAILTSENITIKNNYIYCCNRQGISVVSSNGVIIAGNYIYNIIGTDPGYCIDIEPGVNQHSEWNSNMNFSTSATDNIVISNNKLNNIRAILCMYTVNDLQLNDNEIYGNINLYNSDGKIEIARNDFYGNKYYSLQTSGRYFNIGDRTKILNYTEKDVNKRTPQCVLIHNNNFYISIVKIQTARFAEIYSNNFNAKTEKEDDVIGTCNRIELTTTPGIETYKKCYIHDNTFCARSKEGFNITNINNNVFNPKGYAPNEKPVNFYYNKYCFINETKEENDNEFFSTKNIIMNENAEKELKYLKGENEDYLNKDELSEHEKYLKKLSQRLY